MIKADRRLLLSFDWLLFLTCLALSAAGIAAIWSTTFGTSMSWYFGRQIIYLACALIGFLTLLFFDYHFFSDFITIIYIGGLVVLALVLVIGLSVHSNKSWISLGIVRFQPSEFMKVVVVIALGKYYSELDLEYLSLRELLIGGLIVFVPILMVVMQKDLGTAVTFLPIYGVLTCLAGIRRKHLITILVIAAIAAPSAWFMLRDVQRDRFKTVFNAETDPHRLGYQTIQSEIAIGSGRFLGKGFRHGSQGNLGFLPARVTDFVFSVLAEEKGFAGSITILGLFLFGAFRLFRIAREARDKIGSYIVVGILSIFLFHIIINVGMVVGLLPIAGIPLPFVSAGGSSLISFYAAMSLCIGVRMRRYVN
jgi:rod shape determining protein RodA